MEMTRNLDNYRSQGVFFHDYYPNGEWDIIRAPAMRNQKKYSCCLQPYYDITYALVLKRKTLFYTVHLIIPCVGISFLSFIVFYLPSQSGEKIVLCISIELALTVIFPLLADLIPSTSIMMPLLGKYLLFIMILVALSILNAIVILAIYYREEKYSKQMPRWMKSFFIEVLPPFLLLSTQKQEEMKKIKVKRLMKLPRDNTLDAIFSRMLEKLLHLGEIERIFSKFDTAVIKNKVKQRNI
jgi:nicotinic acetylcholine receptor